MTSTLLELKRFFDEYEAAHSDEEDEPGEKQEHAYMPQYMAACVEPVNLDGMTIELRIQGHAVSRHAQRNGRVVEETAEELGGLIQNSISSPSLASLLAPLILKPERKAQGVFIRDRRRELLYLVCIQPDALVVQTVFDYSRERLFYKPGDKCFLVNPNDCARVIRGNDSGFVKKVNR